MFKRIVFWILNHAGGYYIGAVLGSSAVVALMNWVVRQFTIPSWEVAWVLWTSTAFVAYVT